MLWNLYNISLDKHRQKLYNITPHHNAVFREVLSPPQCHYTKKPPLSQPPLETMIQQTRVYKKYAGFPATYGRGADPGKAGNHPKQGRGALRRGRRTSRHGRRASRHGRRASRHGRRTSRHDRRTSRHGRRTSRHSRKNPAHSGQHPRRHTKYTVRRQRQHGA